MMLQNENNNEGSGKVGWRDFLIRGVPFAIAVSINLPLTVMWSWTSTLPKLEEDTSSFIVTENDVSWLVSVSSLVGIVAALFGGSLLELLGPKHLIQLVMVPKTAFWLLMAFTPNLPLLYLGRIGVAFCMSLAHSALAPLLTELSCPEERGFIVSCSEIVAAASLLAGYINVHFLPWRISTAVFAAPCLMIFSLMFFVPESPYWLIRKNRKEDAEQSLRRTRLPGHYVSKELEAMTAASSNAKTSTFFQVKLLKERENVLPLFLAWLIIAMRECGGGNVVVSYSVYIFYQAKVEIDPFICTIIIGASRLIGQMISTSMMDCVGRKPFLGASSLICGLSLLISGLFLELDLPHKSLVTLGFLFLFLLSFGLGIAAIPWLYAGELIPTPVRSLGSSLLVFTFNLVGFAMNYAFLKITAELGLGVMFVLISLPNFAILLIVILWIPETKGRSLEDLQEAFRK